MYPVSNAFLDAVKANNRKYYWTGRITTTAGTVYEFDQDDMVKPHTTLCNSYAHFDQEEALASTKKARCPRLFYAPALFKRFQYLRELINIIHDFGA